MFQEITMFKLNDRLPKYLLEKFQLISTVVFAALFSLVFLLLSVPFSHSAWFQLGPNKAFGATVIFFVLSLAIVIAIKRIMYVLRNNGLTYLKYILICFGEIVILALLYTFFTIEGGELGYLQLDDRNFENIFGSALLYGLISMGFPYTFCALYFALQDKDRTISMMNYSNVVSDVQVPIHDEKRINLCDNNGMLKLSINEDRLIFIQADDNYIQVWYTDSTDAVKQYMLRCRLKTIEDSFADSNLVRCHRKYIVNISKVNILKGGDKGYVLDMGLPGLAPLPVSKTYEQAILARFNSR